jgi:GNAT superfamily N-acetyltransferase
MITVKIIDRYSKDLSIGVGKLMPTLSPKLSDQPISSEILKDIINSPYHGLFVAFSDSEIVGVAVLSIVMGIDIGRNAYLESFVVSPDFQGQGISGKIWDEMIKWAQAHDCKKLEFTSRPKRERATAFYQKHGAVIYPTNFFRVVI